MKHLLLFIRPASSIHPPPPGFDFFKTINPDHRWKGHKKFYPNAVGLSNSSQVALQLVWFPFYASFSKLGLCFVLPYRALSSNIPVPLGLGYKYRSPTTIPTRKGGRQRLVPEWHTFLRLAPPRDSWDGLSQTPMTNWEAQCSAGLQLQSGLCLDTCFRLSSQTSCRCQQLNHPPHLHLNFSCGSSFRT